MIILVVKKDGSDEKCFIKDEVVFAVGESNEKLHQIKTKDISFVYSLETGSIEKVPYEIWIDQFHKHNGWKYGSSVDGRT